jgi:Na+-driven multidrug efflux pump
MIVSLARQLGMLLPAAYLLSLTGRLELVWLAFPIAECGSVALTALYLRRNLPPAGSHPGRSGVKILC